MFNVFFLYNKIHAFLLFLYHIFSLMEYDMDNEALICLPIVKKMMGKLLYIYLEWVG